MREKFLKIVLFFRPSEKDLNDRILFVKAILTGGKT